VEIDSGNSDLVLTGLAIFYGDTDTPGAVELKSCAEAYFHARFYYSKIFSLDCICPTLPVSLSGVRYESKTIARRLAICYAANGIRKISCQLK
jgi:hypothetical protein